jgi:small subunit ribosomal protein S21e
MELLHSPSCAYHRNNSRTAPAVLLLFCSCSAWTNKLITAKDHASVQVNIGHLNEEGVYTNTFTTFALAGKVRAQGEGDSALDVMWRKKTAEGAAN